MNNLVKIIAGPCSVDYVNKTEILDSLKIEYRGKSALFGVRIVGLKSRTNYDPINAFIGIDIEVYNRNCDKMVNFSTDIEILPSIKIANEIQESFPSVYIATEIVDSWVQMSCFSKHFISSKLIAWNPAVNHLGFPLQTMARFAKKHNWKIGIKNGKSLGGDFEQSEIKKQQVSLDKSWAGLGSYVEILPKNDIFFIHRGVDLIDNCGFRNFPVHELCKRVKLHNKQEMFLDPSHICGPKKRNEIVDFTIDAMKIKCDDAYLYDGILIECGTSKSDTEQHITHSELEKIVSEITKFREI